MSEECLEYLECLEHRLEASNYFLLLESWCLKYRILMCSGVFWECLGDVWVILDIVKGVKMCLGGVWGNLDINKEGKSVNTCNKSSNFVMLWNYCLSPSAINYAKNINHGVSGRCLEGVWVTLGTVWIVLMPNQFIKFQWILFQSAGFFIPSGLW